MLGAFTVGRWFGIRLDVHASWFVIYAFVTWVIANDAPIAALGRGPAVALGAFAGLALFAGVVIHEFAHACVARAFGTQTRSIALFLFGGVATIEAEPAHPLVDALVAIAGPAASAALAALGFGALHVVDRVVPAAGADAAAAILAYIIWTNAVLAIFNLLPAYPMDGGRVLRALLWWVRRDRDGATASASLIGIVFACGFGIAGLVAAVAFRSWAFGWYVAVAAFLARECWRQYRSVRRFAPAAHRATQPPAATGASAVA
jgi:Zn-dependent protease